MLSFLTARGPVVFSIIIAQHARLPLKWVAAV
jgi:hypothetical protein